MGYFKPNTKSAIKLAIAVKSLTAGLAGMAYFSNNQDYVAIIGATGLILNEIINFLSDATKTESEVEK